MGRRSLIAAAALVAAAASVSVVASAQTPPAASTPARENTGTLPGGVRYTLHANALFPFATVALWFRAPQDGFAEKSAPGIARLAAESIDLSAPIIGKPLAQRVADVGGRLSVSTYPDSVAVTAVVPATAAREIVRLMTVAYFSPVLQDDAVRIAQRDVAQSALVRTFSSEGTLDDDLMAALFTIGPAHAPQLGTPRSVVALEPAAVRTFAQRAFRSQNAVLVLTGAVDSSLVSAASSGRAGTTVAALAMPEPAATSVPARHPLPTESASVVGEAVGLGWIGPAIADEREATALDFLTDYLFRPEYGTVARALSPALELNGRFVTYHDPGVVLVTVSGTGSVAARRTIESALAAAQTPLPPAVFEAARLAFLGRVLDDVASPPSDADTLGWYSVEGDLPYAPGNGGPSGAYFTNAAALTPDFVAATARKYLDGPGAVVTLTQAKAPE